MAGYSTSIVGQREQWEIILSGAEDLHQLPLIVVTVCAS